MAAALERGPAEAQDTERDALQQLDAALQSEQGTDVARLVGADGKEVAIPAVLLRVLRQAAHYLAQDKLVSVVPLNKELTTQQAADILNVSRPYMVRCAKKAHFPLRRLGHPGVCASKT